jgi:uncharacterized protein involved in tolerance to divalent cations
MKIEIICTTTDSDKTANVIAESLVKNNLSPCVHIAPNIQSVYKWKGELDKSGEILLLIKTIPERVQNCKKLILKYHNYDVPEIIVTNGEILNDKYRDWFIVNSSGI